MEYRLKKEKKKIFTLYFYNINYDIISINFKNYICYGQYFTLSRIIHSSILKFQIASYLDVESHNTLFILHDIKHIIFNKNQKIKIYENCDFLSLKKLLLSYRKTLDKSYTAHLNYYNNSIPKAINHIETCVALDDNYKTTSIRQLKAVLYRKNNDIKKRYEQCIKVSTTDEAINYTYNKLDKDLQCLEALNTMETNLMTLQ